MVEADENGPSSNPRQPLFRPIHDHVLRAFLLIAGMALLLVTALSGWYWQTSSWQWIGFASDQPVQFSHKHHVSQLGIDCRYCHTGVESSSFAGIPPTETCMTCHSQLWTQAQLLQPVRTSAETNRPLQWHRVTSLPNYVYFNHSVHINRGVACATCHGRVDQMSMTYQAVDMKMSWCLACHRNPETRLVPTSQVTKPQPNPHALNLPDWNTGPLAPLTASQKTRLTDCSVCHR
jgi:hypothetical protein